MKNEIIELYYWTTPNGHKIAIFLEEAKVPYKIIPVNISKDEQFSPDFLKISPNNKIPAIVDPMPLAGNKPISVFESGAILIYLAQKTGLFIPQGENYVKALEWLFWQVAGLGPMAGQFNHFMNQAPEKIPYAIERYQKEVMRLYKVLEKQLENKPFIAGEYSIADMACYPWVAPFIEKYQQQIGHYSNIERWCASIKSRPAVQKVYAQAKEMNPKA